MFYNVCMDAIITEASERYSEGALYGGNSGIQLLKACARCGALKTVEDFSGNKRKNDGLDVHCRYVLASACARREPANLLKACAQAAVHHVVIRNRSGAVKSVLLETLEHAAVAKCAPPSFKRMVETLPFASAAAKNMQHFSRLTTWMVEVAHIGAPKAIRACITSCEGSATPRAFKSFVSIATSHGAAMARVHMRLKPI